MAERDLAGSKKNVGRRGTVVFLDESGFSESAVFRRTWAPKGRTPLLRPKGRSYRWASAIGAIAYRINGCEPRVFMKWHRKTVQSEEVIDFLKHLRRHVKGRVVLVWDKLHAHRSKITREWIEAQRWLETEYLPSYAPDLNPVELLWGHLKGKELANVCEDTLDPIVERVRRGTRRVRHRHGMLWAFLRNTGLSI